ncbi:TPA: EAL domain-containing protein [Pseudomonas aeruginosa]|uniref:EAL domain-containing protein n=1 Tax=Pseudomonas citronellolis TaxID=53408 RepID=UPI001A2D8481|nr:EAL domain-containing protein [Pseudomonas citronellolis]MBH3547432.1 EAL domain-containing protein [Pseudomonas aeruginosa]UUC47459.1 EAL domain-containing protein [Pseudomonas citronellolis]HBN9703306.1 EAL domain-containing protein [Pseudomonas aeruginosa]HBN9721854.1 EAL domain-containing protein [Pseudomonas aeruginosa]HBN9767933.1 EAL domain-containing protein [Pseudomonas aeruginosa]
MEKGRGVNWARILLLSFITMAVGAICGVLVINELEQQHREAGQNVYTERALARSTEVAEAVRQALHDVAPPSAEACSDLDLEKLRSLVLESRFLSDVGRVKGNDVLCTGVRGRLQPPVRFAMADRIGEQGIRYWSEGKILPEQKLLTSLVGTEKTIVSIAPHAYFDVDDPGKDLSALVASRADGYVYHHFGTHAQLQRVPVSTRPAEKKGHAVTRCNSALDLCVTSYLHPPRLLLIEPRSAVTAAVFGAGLFSSVMLVLSYFFGFLSDEKLSARLLRALKRGALEVHYQPIVCLASGRCIAVEALARWTDSSLGRVPPDVFIDVLEKSGDIELLTRFVLRRTLKQLGPMLKNDRAFYVSINVTGKDLTNPDFTEFTTRQLAMTEVLPSQVALELTERTTEEQGALLVGMTRLRLLGLKISIDDFGTGHSNLVYLANLPVDAIKIDKFFTQSIGDSSVVELIFDKLCSIVEQLDIDVVVEGIETKSQADYVLQRLPEALGQGWYFSRSLSLAQFADFYRKSCRSSLSL